MGVPNGLDHSITAVHLAWEQIAGGNEVSIPGRATYSQREGSESFQTDAHGRCDRISAGARER